MPLLDITEEAPLPENFGGSKSIQIPQFWLMIMYFTKPKLYEYCSVSCLAQPTFTLHCNDFRDIKGIFLKSAHGLKTHNKTPP